MVRVYIDNKLVDYKFKSNAEASEYIWRIDKRGVKFKYEILSEKEFNKRLGLI